MIDNEMAKMQLIHASQRNDTITKISDRIINFMTDEFRYRKSSVDKSTS